MPNPASSIPTSYKGTDVQTADWRFFLEVTSGLSTLPAMRGADWRVGGADGAIALGRVPDVLQIMLEGRVKGASRADYRAALMELKRLFRPRGGPGALTVTLEDGTVLTANARALNMLPGPLFGASSALSVEMEAVDPPYWLGETVTDAARALGAGASPVAFALDHPGTEQASRIVLDFLGPVTNPRVTNDTNGVYAEVLVDVPAGQHLVVDVDDYTALLNGVSAIGSVNHSGDRRWFLLEPGNNDLVVTYTGGGGSLTTSFEPPYL